MLFRNKRRITISKSDALKFHVWLLFGMNDFSFIVKNETLIIQHHKPKLLREMHALFKSTAMFEDIPTFIGEISYIFSQNGYSQFSLSRDVDKALRTKDTELIYILEVDAYVRKGNGLAKIDELVTTLDSDAAFSTEVNERKNQMVSNFRAITSRNSRQVPFLWWIFVNWLLEKGQGVLW